MSFFGFNSSIDRAVHILLYGENYVGEFGNYITKFDPRTISGVVKLDHNMTLLHVAAEKKNTGAVKALLYGGADYRQVDCFKRTAYDIAVLNNDYPTLKVFQDYALEVETRGEKERIAKLSDSVTNLTRKCTSYENSNTSLLNKNKDLVVDNETLRRSVRIAKQREDQLLKEKEEIEKDRDIHKKRCDTMRDKIFRK
jgi:hypothetical protein